jgi:hypothetical protein
MAEEKTGFWAKTSNVGTKVAGGLLGTAMTALVLGVPAFILLHPGARAQAIRDFLWELVLTGKDLGGEAMARLTNELRTLRRPLLTFLIYNWVIYPVALVAVAAFMPTGEAKAWVMVVLFLVLGSWLAFLLFSRIAFLAVIVVAFGVARALTEPLGVRRFARNVARETKGTAESVYFFLRRYLFSWLVAAFVFAVLPISEARQYLPYFIMAVFLFILGGEGLNRMTERRTQMMRFGAYLTYGALAVTMLLFVLPNTMTSAFGLIPWGDEKVSGGIADWKATPRGIGAGDLVGVSVFALLVFGAIYNLVKTKRRSAGTFIGSAAMLLLAFVALSIN